MDYSKIFSKFPVLEGEHIRLRKIVARDIEALYLLLMNRSIVQEYLPNGRFESMRQVANNYLVNAEVRFMEQTQLGWAIEHIESSKIIGIRELFIDSPIKSVTVQGFIGWQYRNKGYSAEAYSLIIEFVKSAGATGILANTSIDNFPAIALLYSVGFVQKYVKLVNPNEMRALFINEFHDFNKPTFTDDRLKKLTIFCKMYLQGSNILIKNHSWVNTEYENLKGQWYVVKLIGCNTTNSYLYERKIEFYSNGYEIIAHPNHEYVAIIDGSESYMDAWQYIWNFCVVG